MRPQVVVFILAIAITLLAVVFWMRPTKHASLESQPQGAAQSNTNHASQANRSSQNIQASSTSSGFSQPDSSAAESHTVKPDDTIQTLNDKRNVPIVFYGQVVDENNTPLSGVKVNITIPQEFIADSTVNGDLQTSNHIVYLVKETSTDGHFDISGERGYGVQVESIEKDGYESEPITSSHNAVEGSFFSPTVFRMWPTNLHETLTEGEKHLQVIPDGRPYFVNLTAGEISETESAANDLKFWIKYPEKVERGRTYPWLCEIDAIHGGLVESPQGTAMPLAPSEGYVPTFSMQQQIREGQRGTTGDKSFYVMLNDGKIFGRIQINLIAPYNTGVPGMVRLSYAINPSGSRILR